MRTFLGLANCSRCGGCDPNCYVCNEPEPENDNMNTTEETETITSEDVAEWMKQQLAKAHQLNNYAHLQVEINASTQYPDAPVKFSIYLTQFYGTRDRESFEECFEELSEMPRVSIAEQKRKQAAALLAEADKLEGVES